MALKIRLKRMGSNKKPTYRIVVLDSHFSGKGRRIEDLGTYNPRAKEESQVVNLKKEAIAEWVKKGAVATDTVQGILNKAGVSLYQIKLDSNYFESTQRTSMKELIEFVAKSLVDKPENVAIEQRLEGNLTVLELRVSKEDYGKIIGKQGRTIKALRTLVSASCAKHGLKYSLEVVE